MMKKLSDNNRYIPYLDGCRGFAISIVLLAHAGLENIIPGGFGVTVFFFISGYLITKLLVEELENTGTINLTNFYLRRFFRLYPALLVMIILSLLAVFIMGCTVSDKDILSSIFYFTNYYIGWIRQPVPDCSRIFDIIWSLSIEEHFYLFFPFLTSLFLVAGNKKIHIFFLIFLLLLCVFALAARLILLANHPYDLANASGRIYFSTHTRMDSILWGCISAFLLFRLNADFYLSILKNRKYLIAGLLLLFISFLIRNSFFRDTIRFSLQGIALSIVIPSLSKINTVFSKAIFENRLIVFIGKISYSLYLFHWVVLKIANHYLPEFSFHWQLFYWSLSISLSFLSFSLIEKPFRGLRRKFGSHIQK